MEKLSFSIITTVYKKQNVLSIFLSALLNQQYDGKYEVIILIDNSPDDSISIAEKFIIPFEKKGAKLVIINNPHTMGNCVSRNSGIQHATGSILIIIDCDCIMDVDYLEKYNKAYFYQDCDVVLGPINIETNGQDPIQVLNQCKNKIKSFENPQDSINRRSFLNTVTRNFSIKRSFIKEPLFDPTFSHIADDPATGFGWEDIEMGYRLYKQGARIKYISETPTVHVTHSPSIEDQSSIPLRSLKNFRRLHEKHPQFFNITRRWSIDTYNKIKQWVISCKKDPINDDALFLENHFGKYKNYNFWISKDKRLKILTYSWHPSHQYELHKLPYDFTLITNSGSNQSSKWYYGTRPLPDNDTLNKLEKIKTSEYDLAIFHFDEDVLHPEYTNGKIDENWGLSFRYFVKHINLPKIGICHGVPQFYGSYDPHYNFPDLMEIREDSRQDMINFVGDTLIICNSYQAYNEWKFKKSKCIWHGMDPTEFPKTTYTQKVLGLTNMLARPHYRGADILKEVSKKLPSSLKPQNLNISHPDRYTNRHYNEYAYARYRNYIDNIRKYSIYFNPTQTSPMPRSRTEAMMCGLAIVTTNNHDVNMFIKNGINGFYSNDPNELVEYIKYLNTNSDIVKKIGSAGRQTAIDIFNHDRYLFEWQEVIKSII